VPAVAPRRPGRDGDPRDARADRRGTGKTFQFAELSAAHKAEILLGMKEGSRKVDEKVAAIGKMVNGWHVRPGDPGAHWCAQGTVED
jgi:hypothetical protein